MIGTAWAEAEPRLHRRQELRSKKRCAAFFSRGASGSPGGRDSLW
jgi:hypothetical protein